MGMKQIFVICVIFLLVNENQATLPAFVIAQYAPKIAALSAKIGLTVLSGGAKIAKGRNDLERVVNTAQSSVNGQVNDLNNLVNQAKNDAKQSGKDISKCVKNEKSQLKKINLYALNECRTPWSVKLLDLKLAQIATEEAALAVSVKLCIIEHPLSGSRLKKCFDKEMQKIEDELTAINSEILNTLEQAQSDSHNCIEKNLGSLDIKIEEVSTNFQECVQSV